MKYLGLAALALTLSVSASAATIQELCTGAISPAGSPAISPPVAITCANFGSIGAATFNSVQIEAVDSFSQGNTAGTTVIDFFYSAIAVPGTSSDPFPTNSCLGAGLVTTGCEDQVSGISIGGSGVYNFGGAITTQGSWTSGAGNEAITTVSSNADATSVSPALFSNGTAGTQFFALLTYTPPQASTPEPASMMLLGSGLLAAGLIGRKKLVRK